MMKIFILYSVRHTEAFTLLQIKLGCECLRGGLYATWLICCIPSCETVRQECGQAIPP